MSLYRLSRDRDFTTARLHPPRAENIMNLQLKMNTTVTENCRAVSSSSSSSMLVLQRIVLTRWRFHSHQITDAAIILAESASIMTPQTLRPSPDPKGGMRIQVRGGGRLILYTAQPRLRRFTPFIAQSTRRSWI